MAVAIGAANLLILLMIPPWTVGLLRWTFATAGPYYLGMLTVVLTLLMATAGEVSFANSGAPAAQADFLRGLALLHDFEYGRAAESFRKAQKIDPAFVMAYW